MESLSTQERTRPVVLMSGQDCQTILVVEDERFVRDVTCELLSEVGYHVLSAESAVVAKGFFFPGMQPIDLLLCDAVLSDESGVDLSRDLSRISPELKIVLVSGYAASIVSRPFDRERTVHFLTKPYSAASLMAKIQCALRVAVPSGESLSDPVAGSGPPAGFATVL